LWWEICVNAKWLFLPLGGLFRETGGATAGAVNHTEVGKMGFWYALFTALVALGALVAPIMAALLAVGWLATRGGWRTVGISRFYRKVALFCAMYSAISWAVFLLHGR
jgi:hypothetical protein